MCATLQGKLLVNCKYYTVQICHRRTLQLIRSKSLMCLPSQCNVIKLLRSQFTNVPHKFKFLSSAGLSSLAQCLWVRKIAHCRVQKLKGASQGQVIALLISIRLTGKAYQGQTFQFIRNICKLRRQKSFMNLFTRVGFILTRKHQSSLEKPTRDKCPSL